MDDPPYFLNSLFFSSFEKLVEEVRGWNQDKLESLLKDGKIVFRRFDPPYTVKTTVEIYKIQED